MHSNDLDSLISDLPQGPEVDLVIGLPQAEATVPDPWAVWLSDAGSTLTNFVAEWWLVVATFIALPFVVNKAKKPISTIGRGISSVSSGVSRTIGRLGPAATAAMVGCIFPPAVQTIHKNMELEGSGAASAWIGAGIIMGYCLVSQIRSWNKVPEKAILQKVSQNINHALNNTTDIQAQSYLKKADKDLSEFC